MEFFRGVNVNWLGYKWYFLAFSMIFSVAGIVKMSWNWSHIGSIVPLSVDFRGGTEIQVQFASRPDLTAIRKAIDAAGITDERVQNYGDVAANEVLISLPRSSDETSVDTGRRQIVDALHQHYSNPFDDNGIKVDSVGATVGQQLKAQATRAVLYSMLGMLVYLWFRFQLIYGVAAVVACFHDTLITVGAFALFNKEISLTVIAAILTLVGYSMNDTIVIFDRIRENLKLSRREPLERVMNTAVNQTLSRTVMTSGLTFLTALALFLFGGPVLHGFSFALVCGILVGTYSSVFIASPIVLFWHNYADQRRKTAPAVAAATRTEPVRKPTKAVK